MKFYTYNPEEFVDREGELSQVIDEVITAPGKRKVVLFKGGRGAGKSWLISKLYNALLAPGAITSILNPIQKKTLSKLKVRPFLIGMFPLALPATTRHDQSIYTTTRTHGMEPEEIPDLLSKIIKRYELTKLQDLKKVLSEQSRYLARDLSELPDDETPVFLVDSIFEASEQTRNALEKYILSPILRSQNCLVILSGRGSTPIWSSPELRDPKVIELQPFSEDRAQVSEMLSKLRSPHLNNASLINELSGGYPLTIRLLGKDIRQPLESLNDIINDLLTESLSELKLEELFFVRNYLERLSVIVNIAFRDREIAPILFPDKTEDEGLLKASEIRDILQRHSLVEYRNGGYIINPSILIPIKGYLKYKQSSRWVEYRDKALQRFNQLSSQYEKYPDTRTYYQELIRKINANNNEQGKSLLVP